jgi:cellulose synthase/poly-beta-1,6-N-acetylglucosamine synthase-like glycosyltransferase
MTPDWFAFEEALTVVIPVISWLVISTGLLQNAIYVFQLIMAFYVLKRRVRTKNTVEAWWKLSDATMPISILAPAYNEEATIVESVRSLLALHYPNFEVVVINDGSKDRTLAVLIEAFGLEPTERLFEEKTPHNKIRGLWGSPRHARLLVIDKENGGKADALNAGINVARSPLFCAVDADSLLEADALLRATQPFVDDPERVVAVGGTIRLANGCQVRNGRILSIGVPRNIVALFQVVEYIRAFLMARLAWSQLNALMLISGAFGIMRRSVALEVGGYSLGTVGEDLELIVKIHRYMRDRNQEYEIRFIPDPVCWTEAPESMNVLSRQRRRWQRGALETFFKHKDMLLNPRYGIAGMLGFPHILLVDVLAPPIEAIGYLLMPIFWATGAISWEFFAAYLALTFAFGVFISVGTLVLEEMELKRFPTPSDLMILTLAAIAENFGYRQINNFWRIRGWWEYLRGSQSWGEMTRKGFHKGV